MVNPRDLKRASRLHSADRIIHQLLFSDINLCREMVCLLGSGVLVNKTLDRRCIANLIFHDLELLKALETLVHPVVLSRSNRI